MSYDLLKRAVDVVVAGLALLVLWPVILVVGLLVRTKLGSPVLFRQQRPGLHGRPFELLKFRTMLARDPSWGPESEDAAAEEEVRMTGLGRRLRMTSLDELPSLFNVLRGDLSLVGPRPLRMHYLPWYSEKQARRHEVRPGITGLAQVSGRNGLGWDDRLDLDIEYVDSRGPLLDTRILLRTVATVLRRDGIAEEGAPTMSNYRGPRRTENLGLRPRRTEDLVERADWLPDPTLVAEDATRRRDYVAIDRRSGEIRALCGLTAMTPRDARLYVGVEPRMRGRGLESQAIELLKTEARALGLVSVHLGGRRSTTGRTLLLRETS